MSDQLEPIDGNISRFIKEHHVLTLATVNDGIPYCSNMFYSFMKEELMIVFTSSTETKHCSDFILHPEVAASIVLSSKIVGKVRGIQICGLIIKPEGELLNKAKISYLKRFPYAVVMDLELWCLKIKYAKLTDNRLGFGKKIVYGSI